MGNSIIFKLLWYMWKFLFKEKWYVLDKFFCFRKFYFYVDIFFIVNFMYVLEVDIIGKILDLMLFFCFLLFCNFRGLDCLYLEIFSNNY